MYTELFALFNRIVTLKGDEIELINNSFHPLFIPKGDFFLEAGKVNRHVGFLNKGLVRYFVYKDGEESTFEFTKEGEFIGDYQSFNNKSVSVQTIQAIEDCEILAINYSDVQSIFNRTKHGNLIGRVILEHRFNVMVNQLLAVYMQNPEQRYRSFMKNYSELSQRIPQYLIASYVGVKPESLSRIRKRVMKRTS